MGAAAWTLTALDITGDPTKWAEYLSKEQLSDAIGLAPKTIIDTLARNPKDEDPRSAIYRPAARIGQTRVAAVPMWSPAQRDAYKALATARDDRQRAKRRATAAGGVDGLPVYNVADAAEKGLASTEELAEITGFAENTLRRFAREGDGFPPEVGIAERVPPNQMGPPRVLRNVEHVRAWLARNVVRTSTDDGTVVARDASSPAA